LLEALQTFVDGRVSPTMFVGVYSDDSWFLLPCSVDWDEVPGLWDLVGDDRHEGLTIVEAVDIWRRKYGKPPLDETQRVLFASMC
jgi:hypothetical protein